MTKFIRRRSNVKRWFVIGMIGVLAACGQANVLEKKEQNMTGKEMTLWQVIDHIGGHLPLRREKIEQLFQSTLVKMESSNQYVTFWEGNGGTLRDGKQISRIVLAVRNDDPQDPGMLTLNVSGTCVKRDEIGNKYGELTVVHLSSGRSEDEETTFEAKAPWGKLAFGFAERNSDCLSSVGFGPNKKSPQ